MNAIDILRDRAQQGCTRQTLLRIARELIPVVALLKMPSASRVTAEQIGTVAERWARQQYRRGRAHSLRWSRKLFVQTAVDWLRFLGRLDEPTAKPLPFKAEIEEYRGWMTAERGLSPITIYNYSWHLKQFLQWCEEHSQPLGGIQVSDVDAFLGSRGNKGWCRVSIVTSVKALKSFFYYAGQRGRCNPRIATAVQGPRLFSQSTLPSGPSWEGVERLITHVTSDQPLGHP